MRSDTNENLKRARALVIPNHTPMIELPTMESFTSSKDRPAQQKEGDAKRRKERADEAKFRMSRYQRGSTVSDGSFVNAGSMRVSNHDHDDDCESRFELVNIPGARSVAVARESCEKFFLPDARVQIRNDPEKFPVRLHGK